VALTFLRRFGDVTIALTKARHIFSRQTGERIGLTCDWATVRTGDLEVSIDWDKIRPYLEKCIASTSGKCRFGNGAIVIKRIRKKDIPLVEVRIEDSGHLSFTLTDKANADLLRHEPQCFLNLPEGLTLLEPLDYSTIGALTDAPIIAENVIRRDDGTLLSLGRVWWHADYAVENLADTVRTRGYAKIPLANTKIERHS